MKETPFWYSILWIIGFMLFKVFFSLTRQGKKRIPKDGGVLLLANHRSYLDPIVLALLIPRKMNFMAKEELFCNPIFGYLIRKLGAFPLKRERLDKRAYQRALKILKEDKILVLFPEGTRSHSGKLGELKEGPMRIALSSQVPVIPVVIKGTERILPPGAKFIRRGKIQVRAGEPIFPSNYPGEKKKISRIMLRELRKNMLLMGADE